MTEPSSAVPPRVLFYISSLEAGGAERQVATLLQHLDRARVAPLLYLDRRCGPFLNYVPTDVPVFVFDERVDAPRWKLPGAIHRQQVADLRQVIVSENIDVLYERTFLQTLVGAPATRGTSCRRLAIITSNPIENLPRVAGRFLAIKKRLLRQAYTDAKGTAAVSGGVAEAARVYYDLQNCDLDVCEDHVDLDEIDRQAAVPCPDALADSSAKHLLAVGRLVEAKGFDLLLESIAKLPERCREILHVHILGNGPERSQLQTLAETLSLERVHFHGHIDNPYTWMRNADFFVLSSRYEGLPNVLIEAMACQLPIVSFDCQCGPRELLKDGELGQLVADRDLPALTTAILSQLDRPRDAAQLAAARKMVEQKFSIHAGISRVLALVERITPT